jgi:hypothetical protein
MAFTSQTVGVAKVYEVVWIVLPGLCPLVEDEGDDGSDPTPHGLKFSTRPTSKPVVGIDISSFHVGRSGVSEVVI